MVKLLSISVTTHQWTSGNHAWFDARLKPSSSVEVRWGDGQKSVMTPLQTELSRVEHYFKRYESDETYTIEFWSDDLDALIEFQDGLREMTLNSIEFINCPALRKIRFCNLLETDFTNCPALEVLEMINCGCKVMDLRTAPGLRKLICAASEYIEKLILNGNDRLEELECEVNPKLSKITLSNQSSLRRVKFYMTEIDEKSKYYLDRAIEKNKLTEA